MDIRSSSPSAMKIRFTGMVPVTSRIEWNAFHCTICGPFELVAPRPIITFLKGPNSLNSPSNGGSTQASGWVIGMVSYIQ